MGRILSMLTVLFTTIGFCWSFTNSEVFTETPQSTEPYYVREGSPGPILSCTVKAAFTNRDMYQLNWLREHLTISQNDMLYDKQHYQLASDNDGSYGLVIKNVTRDTIDGSYHCKVLKLDTGEQYIASAKVVTLVPPSDPIFTEEPKESIREGESVKLRCSSTGGNPAPDFTWRFPNGSIADTSYVTESNSGTTYSSTLQFPVRSDDNGQYVVCGVSNRATEGEPPKEKTSSRLNVSFKPRARVYPQDVVTAEEGNRIELGCTATGNPQPKSFEWKHLSSLTSYLDAKWPMTVQANMSGQFQCLAKNSVGDGTATLQLEVQYGPKVSTSKEYLNPNEGTRVEVECLVKANPEAREIIWTGPNGFTSQEKILMIPEVRRDQSGYYNCTATNFLTLTGEVGSPSRTGSASILIDVRRRPGHAAILEAPHISVVVGKTIELNCIAPDAGSPPAKYKWATPTTGGHYISHDEEYNQQKLVIRNAQLSFSGKYRCRPHNELGEGEEAIVDLTVIEPAHITVPLTTERSFDSGFEKQQIECEAAGHPSPSISWYKDGRPVNSKRYQTETTILKTSCDFGESCSKTVVGTLVFAHPIQWTDKGNYSCVTSNGADAEEEKSMSWTSVRVKHGPVIITERYPTDGLAAADIGETANIRCVISANPRPSTVVWMHNSEQVNDNDRHSFHMNKIDDRTDEYEHILQIADVKEEDYGLYVCQVANGRDERAQMSIRLQGAGLPGAPDMPKKMEATPQSMIISWRPGFDGGSEQTFLVEYRARNSVSDDFGAEEVSTVTTRNAARIENIEDDGSVNWLASYNLTGLKPLTTYMFRVRASNAKGESSFTPHVLATTDDVHENPHMGAPTSLKFDRASRQIVVQPPVAVDSCALLYIFTDAWHATRCFNADEPLVIEGGQRYKTRFCSRLNQFTCSAFSSELDAGETANAFKLSHLLPIAILVFVVLAVTVLLVVCCRSRTPRRAIKQPPTIVTSLPPNEGKTAAMHGSQADSGVFTLDSGRKNQNTMQSYSSSSEEVGVDQWPTGQYDVSHDPYLTEPTPQLFQAVQEDQRLDDESMDDSVEDDHGGRRVIREIIV